jgi:hypothetical protein
MKVSLSEMNRSACCLSVLVAFFLTIPVFSQIIIDPATGAKAFGPVELRPDQEFELCANSHFGESPVAVQASFHPVRNANVAIRTRSTELAPGDGACTSVSYAEVGDEPIFALLTSDAANPDDQDLVGSACIINGVFPSCPPPIPLSLFNATIQEITTFGPVRLKPDSALQVCSSNAFNGEPTSATVSVFLGRDSSEPIAVRSGTLQPGRGACVSVGYDRVGDRPIFAELKVHATSGGIFQFRRITLGGAAVINGIYEPVPGEFRTVAPD